MSALKPKGASASARDRARSVELETQSRVKDTSRMRPGIDPWASHDRLMPRSCSQERKVVLKR